MSSLGFGMGGRAGCSQNPKHRPDVHLLYVVSRPDRVATLGRVDGGLDGRKLARHEKRVAAGCRRAQCNRNGHYHPPSRDWNRRDALLLNKLQTLSNEIELVE